MTLLRSIFNKARLWGDLHGENPCPGVRKGREAHHRLRYLSQDEIKHLLSVAHPRLYPALACALLTGMRRAELLGLTWANVNLERDTIYVLKSKSGKPREIPVCAKLREILLSLGPKESGSVFELPRIMLRRYFDRALRDAGIVGFRWHDTRHYSACRIIPRSASSPLS